MHLRKIAWPISYVFIAVRARKRQRVSYREKRGEKEGGTEVREVT